MPEQGDMPGGTQGANSALETWARNRFQYSDADSEKIRSFASASDEWIETVGRLFPQDQLSSVPNDERLEWEAHRDRMVTGISMAEGAASKYLSSISSARGKSTPAMQKLYLQKIVSLVDELDVYLKEPTFQHTPADIFAPLRRKWGFGKTAAHELELDYHLTILKLLASRQLHGKPTPQEAAVNAITRKDTYERFMFTADAMSLFERFTGKTATVWVNETPDGLKHSEAIGFVMAVVNPVLQSVGFPPISPETARKEMQEAKKAFASGLTLDVWTFGSGSIDGT